MNLNVQILLFINSWAGKNRILDALMIFCASYLIYIVFFVFGMCVLFLVYKRQWRQVIYALAALVVSFILLKIAAHLYVDHRPFADHHLTQLVAHAAGKSFPSDHTTATMALAIGLLYFTRFKKVGLAVVGCALIIGFARIFVGIHYPVDILGGLLVGLMGGSVVYLFKKYIDDSRKDQTIAAIPKEE